jgi:hypothetical protein
MAGQAGINFGKAHQKGVGLLPQGESMQKLFIALALLSLPLMAVTPTPAACCKGSKASCCSEQCCKASDNCCKTPEHKDCVKNCNQNSTAKK